MTAMFMPTLIGLVLRHALTAGGAYLVANGFIDAGTVEGIAGCVDMVAPKNDVALQVIGGIGALTGLVWSGREKVKNLPSQ